MKFSKALTYAACAVIALALISCSASRLGTRTLTQQGASASWINFDPLSQPRPPLSATSNSIRGYSGWSMGDIKIVAVGDSLEPAPLPNGFTAKYEEGKLSIGSEQPTVGSVYFYVFYPANEIHLSEMVPGSAMGDSQIFLALSVKPGVIALGAAPINGVLPAGEISSVSFAAGAEEVSKAVATVPTNDANAVEDLSVSVNVTGGVTATWTEIHRGDYNNDGTVAVSDITPIAQLYNQTSTTTDNPGRFALVDGNDDLIIGVADITPIAMNFGTLVTGYDIYRTELSGAAEDPNPGDTGRWVYLERAGASPPEQKPSVQRDFTGQDFRLQYTFQDIPPNAAYYAYFVRAFSQDSDSPNEGPISNVAKTSQPTGMPTLTLEAMDGPFYFTGTDMVMRVNLEDATNAFSVNARFEYRSDVLQFVSAAASLPSYDPNFFYDADFGGDPLFLGARIGVSATDPANYDLAGFNATKRAPALTMSGTGPVAYFTFHVIGGSGPISDCFKFPQGTTNIWVWGAQYNVPMPGPQLGQPVLINVSS
jgi:hypothetical protein